MSLQDKESVQEKGGTRHRPSRLGRIQASIASRKGTTVPQRFLNTLANSFAIVSIATLLIVIGFMAGDRLGAENSWRITSDGIISRPLVITTSDYYVQWKAVGEYYLWQEGTCDNSHLRTIDNRSGCWLGPFQTEPTHGTSSFAFVNREVVPQVDDPRDIFISQSIVNWEAVVHDPQSGATYIVPVSDKSTVEALAARVLPIEVRIWPDSDIDIIFLQPQGNQAWPQLVPIHPEATESPAACPKLKPC